MAENFKKTIYLVDTNLTINDISWSFKQCVDGYDAFVTGTPSFINLGGGYYDFRAFFDMQQIPLFYTIWKTADSTKASRGHAWSIADEVWTADGESWQEGETGRTSSWLLIGALAATENFVSLKGATAANITATFSGQLQSIANGDAHDGNLDVGCIGAYNGGGDDMGGFDSRQLEIGLFTLNPDGSVVPDAKWTAEVPSYYLMFVSAFYVKTAGWLTISYSHWGVARSVRAYIPVMDWGAHCWVRRDGTLWNEFAGPVAGTVDPPATTADFMVAAAAAMANPRESSVSPSAQLASSSVVAVIVRGDTHTMRFTLSDEYQFQRGENDVKACAKLRKSDSNSSAIVNRSVDSLTYEGDTCIGGSITLAASETAVAGLYYLEFVLSALSGYPPAQKTFWQGRVQIVDDVMK